MFEILQFEFMQRAFIGGLITAILAPLVGIFLVVRRYSLMVDTLSHVSLLGIAFGLLLNINPYFAATIMAVLGGLGIEKVKDSTKLYQEAILAMFLSGSLAIAIIIISAGNFSINIMSLLFGSITTITSVDLYIMTALSALVFLVITIFYKRFFLISFDEDLALSAGIKTKYYNYLLVVLAAITISLAIRIVGVLLIGALMVVPVITAMQLNKSFFKTILIATVFSVSSVLIGLFTSYYANFSSGGTIVLVTISFFLLVLITKKFGQLVRR